MMCHVSAWWAQATGKGSGSIQFLLDICFQLILLCLLAPWNHWQSRDVEIRQRRARPRRENWLRKKKAAGRTHPISASLAVRVEKSAYNAGRTPDGLEDGYWPCLTPPPTAMIERDVVQSPAQSQQIVYPNTPEVFGVDTVHLPPSGRRLPDLKLQTRSRVGLLPTEVVQWERADRRASATRCCLFLQLQTWCIGQIFTHVHLLLLLPVCFIGAKQKPAQSADGVDSLHICFSTEVDHASICKVTTNSSCVVAERTVWRALSEGSEVKICWKGLKISHVFFFFKWVKT